MFRQAEIEEFRSGGTDHDVVRLQIAVDDPHGVRGRECAGDLQGKLDDFVWRQGPFHRSPLHILHHEVVRTDVVDLANVGMIERRDRACLLLEPGAVVGLETLDGHHAFQPRVAGLPDLAHTSGAQSRQDLVRTESRAYRHRHISTA